MSHMLFFPIDLQFSPNSYEVNLIPGVSNGPGSHVTTIGFNRPLQNSEVVIFLPSTSKIVLDRETLNITVATGATIVTGLDVTIAVLSSGSLVSTASLKITVIDPGNINFNDKIMQFRMIQIYIII